MDYDIFRRLLREKEELWGTHFTVVSGGEPLLWRSQGKSLLDICREFQDQYFMMYTNGTLIDRETAQAMAEVGNITPAISLEGMAEDTDNRRGTGTFDKTLKAFEALKEAGVPFGVSLTATRYNLDRLLSDEYVSFCFDTLGATFGWVFQYMPIGRGYTLDNLVTPEQRIQMYKRVQYLIREKNLFLADFWNSGAASHGCISAGRGGGYFYIDWKGDVMPCAFFPYSTANIKQVYAEGGDLNTVVFSPYFKDIRHWQLDYEYDPEKQNWITPCPIRDHHQLAYRLIREHQAKPADQPAAEALADASYHTGLEAYNDEVGELSQAVWDSEYRGVSPSESPGERQSAA